MEEPNYISREISTTDLSAKYDACVKRVLAAKEILARILVFAVPEFQDYTFDEAKLAIDGKPEISTKSVTPVPEAVVESKNESKLPGEGTVYFDIVFSVHTKDGECRKIIINLEAQNNSYPGYSIASRGIVYCARLISEQLDREFTTSTYDNAKKVYSIWICMKPPKEHSEKAIPANHIVQYEIVPEIVFPQNANPDAIALGKYDLLSVIIITLVADPEKTDNELIGILSTLLSGTIDAAAKKRKLSKKYGVPMTRKVNEEVTSMCNLSKGLIEDAVEGAVEKAVEQTKKQCMDEFAKKEAAIRKEKDARIAELEALLAEKREND